MEIQNFNFKYGAFPLMTTASHVECLKCFINVTPERNAKYVPQPVEVKEEKKLNGKKREGEKTRTKRYISHKYLCVVENSIS